jgi:hypothetical protein
MQIAGSVCLRCAGTVGAVGRDAVTFGADVATERRLGRYLDVGERVVDRIARLERQ